MTDVEPRSGQRLYRDTTGGHRMTCPYCGRLNNTHVAPSDPDDPPEPGDSWVCWCCGNAGIYDDFNGILLMRLPTDEEAAEIEADHERFVKVMQGSITPSSAIIKLQEKD